MSAAPILEFPSPNLSPVTDKELVAAARTACDWYVRTVQVEHRHNFTISNLSGMCGLASLMLRDVFRETGRNAELVRGTVRGINHCWVECAGILYDITFSQFDLETPVWVGPVASAPHVRRTVYKGIRSFCFWPRHLLPTPETLALLKRQLNGSFLLKCEDSIRAVNEENELIAA